MRKLGSIGLRPINFDGRTLLLYVLIAFIVGVACTGQQALEIEVGIVAILAVLMIYMFAPVVFVGLCTVASFYGAKLPSVPQLIDTPVKIAELFIIAFGILSTPYILFRTKNKKSIWLIMLSTVVSLGFTQLHIAMSTHSNVLDEDAMDGFESVVAFFFMLLYVIVKFRSKHRAQQLLRVLPWVLTIGITIHLMNPGSLNKNTFGFLLDLVVPFGLSSVARKGTPASWWFAFGLSCIAIAVDNSRGAIIGVGTALGLYAIMTKYHSRKTIFYYVLLPFVLLLSMPFIPYSVVVRIKHILDMQLMPQESRLALWRGAIPIFEHHALLGIGYYNFGYYYQGIYYQYHFQHPQNMYLNVLVSTGLLGSSVFIFTVIYIAIHVVRSMKESERGVVWLPVGVFLSSAAIFVHGFVDSPLLYGQILLVLGVMIGLAMNARELEIDGVHAIQPSFKSLRGRLVKGSMQPRV